LDEFLIGGELFFAIFGLPAKLFGDELRNGFGNSKTLVTIIIEERKSPGEEVFEGGCKLVSHRINEFSQDEWRIR
jgi:hypothetical protein